MRAATSRLRLEARIKGAVFDGDVAIRALASLRLALVVLVLLGAGALATLRDWVAPTWALALPLTLLAANLSAAVATQPVFRRNVALLVFHLGLVSIALLAAAGRLTYLEGTAEVASGDGFEGTLATAQSGPWHTGELSRVRFLNDGFRIEYDEHGRRIRTQNAVRWRDDDGTLHRVVVGENRPLILHGYRFTTTNNKGYAPAFTWIPKDGRPAVNGRVHLPSYPANERQQARAWQVDALELWAMLQIDDQPLVPGQRGEFRLPTRHRLIVRVDGERHELVPGSQLSISRGTLVYRGLGTWMGYSVHSDWTLPWIAAAGLVSVLALSLHFMSKYRSRPWLAADGESGPTAAAAVLQPLRTEPRHGG